MMDHAGDTGQEGKDKVGEESYVPRMTWRVFPSFSFWGSFYIPYTIRNERNVAMLEHSISLFLLKKET